MKIALFHIATEFHYMVSLNIIDQYFNTKEYEICYLIPLDSQGKRGRLENIKFRSGHTLKEIQYSLFENQYYPDVAALVEFVKKNPVSDYIAFHVYDPIFIYLSYYFKNSKTTCHLAPDGLGIYVKYTGITLGSRARLTWHTYQFFIKNRLFFPVFYFCSYRYGYNGYAKNLFAFGDTLPFSKQGIKISKVNLFLDEQRIAELEDSFNVKIDTKYPLKNVILFINQNYLDFPIYENKVLKVLSENSKYNFILYKCHPGTPDQMLEHLKEFKKVILIKDKFPVELLIAKLENGLIVSSHSTSLLYYNSSCKYIWIYLLLEKMNMVRKRMIIYNPTKYIKNINSITDLNK